MRPKQNHCYGHTPPNTKGAKTPNSGVERMPFVTPRELCKEAQALRFYEAPRSSSNFTTTPRSSGEPNLKLLISGCWNESGSGVK